MLHDTFSRLWNRRSADAQALLPETPADAIELTNDELEAVTGSGGYYRRARRKPYCYKRARHHHKKPRRCAYKAKGKRRYG